MICADISCDWKTFRIQPPNLFLDLQRLTNEKSIILYTLWRRRILRWRINYIMVTNYYKHGINIFNVTDILFPDFKHEIMHKITIANQFSLVKVSLPKKWIFPLRISWVNITKSAENWLSSRLSWDIGIVNWYSWFWKTDPDDEFRYIHARINVRVDITTSMRPRTTKLGKQVLLEEFTHLR